MTVVDDNDIPTKHWWNQTESGRRKH